MQKKLILLIRILAIATFFIPLIVIPSKFIFPFIVPKILLFRTAALLMLGAYLLLLRIDWQRYRPRLTPLTIAVSAFVLSFAISTFAGVDWYHSFWDNHERMLGLFTILHFFAYYIILGSVFKEKKDWEWFLRYFLIGGGIVMFLGFWQKYVNPEALLNRGSYRVSATLGNSIYFSGYGLFLIGAGVLSAIWSKGFWRWFAVIVAILGFWGIFGGGTRGTLLGLLASIFVLCVSYLIVYRQNKKLRYSMIGLLVAGVLSVVLIFVFRETSFVSNLPAVGRLVNTDFKISGSTVPRAMAWGIAVDSWKEKPVFGWGPNNFFFAFNKYYRPQFLESGYGETWFDNAHNIVMNTLAVQGTVGIITYLSVFGTAIFVLWRAYRKNQTDGHMTALGSAFLIGHLVGLITVFENPTSYLYFFFFLAFVNSQISNISAQGGQAISNIKLKQYNISFGSLAIVFTVIFLFIYSTNVNPARANMQTLDAVRGVMGSGDYGFLGQMDNLTSPHIDDIRMDFARSATNVIYANVQAGKINSVEPMLSQVISELEKNLQLHPLDIRNHLTLADLYGLSGRLKKDVSKIQNAEQLLETALELSPKRQQIKFNLAFNKAMLGKTQDAEDLLRSALADDDKIGEAWWRLAEFLRLDGKIDQAIQIAQEAQEKNIVFDANGQTTMQNILGSQQNSSTEVKSITNGLKKP